MSRHETGTRPLDGRAEAVFDAFLAGRDGDLHPADRAEAAAFWDWIGDQRPTDAAGARRPVRRRVALAAVAALLVAMIGGVVGWGLLGSAQERFAASYATRTAERRVIRLADGSTVTLAPDSRVAVAFLPAERRLSLLRGEALFEVAHDRTRPFIVATTHGEVRAVGTAFDVALASDEARVTVVDGTIRVALPGGASDRSEPIVKLARRGERVHFGTARRDGASVGFISQSSPADVAAATAWTRGELVFQGEPLAEAIAVANRYIPAPADRIVLRDPRAARIPVYGVVAEGDPNPLRDLAEHPHSPPFKSADESSPVASGRVFDGALSAR